MLTPTRSGSIPLLAVLAAVSLVGPAAPPARAAERSTRDLLGAGVVALEESQFPRAAARFREALAIDPRLAQAHYGLGLAALGERDRRGAERRLKEAAELMNGSPEVLYALGVARFVFNDPRAARDDLRRAAEADKRFLEAQFALGIIEATLGDLEAATGALREALRIDAANAAAHYQLGGVLACAGRLDEALLELATALEADPLILDARPEDPIIYRRRPLQAGAPAQGLDMPLPLLRPSIAWPRNPVQAPGRVALRVAIPDWYLYYWMALHLEDLRAWHGALDMLERALTIKDRSETGAMVADHLVDYVPHLHLAQVYHRLGNPREASLHLGIARNEANASPEALRSLETLIRRDRLRPRLIIEPIVDRTTDETVRVRGLVVSEEAVQRVEVGGREAILRRPTTAELSELLESTDQAAAREPLQIILFEVPGHRLTSIGENRILIRPQFRNPARDSDLVEIRVVRLPAPAAPPARPPRSAP